MKLSVVIPIYNEQDTLDEIIEQVRAVPLEKHLVLVDDFSTDDTRDKLKRYEGDDDCTVLYHEKNQGKGAALRTGFSAAQGDLVIIQDADLEYSPSDIPTVVAPLINRECDVVYGSRFLGGEHRDKSWVHRLGNGVLTKASNITTGLHLTDMETCYKMLKGELARNLADDLVSKRFGFEPEITARIAKSKARVYEIGISYYGRSKEEGKKIGYRDGIRAIWEIIRFNVFSR